MTNKEYFSLFSEAMNKKKIVRYENSTSRDDYSIYAIRETADGYVFFCLLETFFRTTENAESWNVGSLSSYHEFQFIKGASLETLLLTNNIFNPKSDFRDKLPATAEQESDWLTVE